MFELEKRDIKFLSGVGPQRATTLNKELGIFSLRDLISYYPYKYVDRSRIYAICDLDAHMPYIQIKGEILSIEHAGEGRQSRLIAHFSDGTGVIDLIWFQGIKYVEKNLKVFKPYIVFGRPSVFNQRIQVAHPEIEPAEELQLSTIGLRPFYMTTERMKRMNLHSQAIEKMMRSVIQQITEPLPETLTPELITEHHLLSLTEAIRNIHFPQNTELLKRAELRLKFEELFYVQLNILHYAHDRQQRFRGFVFSKIGSIFNTFYQQNLPFELT